MKIAIEGILLGIEYMEAATHHHATGILSDEIRKIYFLNSPGAANEAISGIQHVVKFEKDDNLPGGPQR